MEGNLMKNIICMLTSIVKAMFYDIKYSKEWSYVSILLHEHLLWRTSSINLKLYFRGSFRFFTNGTILVKGILSVHPTFDSGQSTFLFLLRKHILHPFISWHTGTFSVTSTCNTITKHKRYSLSLNRCKWRK